jgi:SHS family sialic acid transporter-like MFS transporter
MSKPLSSEYASATRGAQWMVLVAAFLGWMFDGLELGIGPVAVRSALVDLLGYASVTKLSVVQEGRVAAWNGGITASFLLGAAAGGLLFGWLGDRIGRVKAMTISILFYSAFTGLCYFATSAWHLAGLRFLAALGMGGEWSLGVALVMECWPAKHRPLLAGVIGAASNVGFLLIGGLAWAFPVTADGWRWVMIVGALPALLTFFIRVFVPESERWKSSVEKTTGVRQPAREIFRGELRGRTLVAIGLAAVALIGTWGSVQWIPLWVEKNVEFPAINASSNLPEAGAGSAARIRARAKGQVQTLSSLGAILGCLAGALLGGFGRRRAYLVLCTASLVLCALLFRTMDTYSTSFLLVVFLVGGVTASFYGWLPLYLPELFPTRVRATGQGLSFNFGRIFAAGGALIAGQLVSGVYRGDYGQMCATVTLIYVVGMMLILLAPETKGQPLPD